MAEMLQGGEPLHSNTPSLDRLLAAVTVQARHHADDWFPDLEVARVRARLLSTESRARCFLHRVELDDGAHRRPVVVKVRHSQEALRRVDRFADRPILTPERTMSDHDTARLEYEGLRGIEQAVGSRVDGRFGILRALAWLPEQGAIVMDQVDEPTLRRRVLRGSRLSLDRPDRGLEVPFHNAGGWLRQFQDSAPVEQLSPRLRTRTEVADRYRAYARFLSERLGRSRLLDEVSSRADELVGAALPEVLPLAPGHGDFVANNMFAAASGRVTVFDPLVRWQVPRYQDLATLSVGLRVVPVQSLSVGLALPRDLLDGCEAALLEGYFGGDRVDDHGVRAFQLLVLLDRWSSTVSKQVHGGRRRRGLHAGRVALATVHYRGEVRRSLAHLS